MGQYTVQIEALGGEVAELVGERHTSYEITYDNEPYRVDVRRTVARHWEALGPAETVEAESSEAAAAMIAQHQHVAEGVDWRVVVWEGADADTGYEPDATYRQT